MEAAQFNPAMDNFPDWGTDTQLQVEYEEPAQNYEESNNPRRFANPYKMPRNAVRIRHFRNARVYDGDAEKGFEVQRWFARKMYNAWLREVRKNPDWKNFRRNRRPVYVEEEDEAGVVFKRMTPHATGEVFAKKDGNKNPTRSTATAQSKDKGVSVEDTDFRPRMFTEKMGREIAQLRNNMSLTQADLAKMINVYAGTIRDIEAGGLVAFNPEDVVVKSLAKALGVASIKYQE